MHINKSRIASVLALAAAALFTASTGHAQTTGSANLTISATVTSSLQILFSKDSSGPALSGTTLPFGNISAYGGNLATGVSMVSASDTTHCSSGHTCFVVSAPVDVTVNAFNSSSTAFTLTAELGTLDSTNYWAIGTVGSTLTSSSTVTLPTTGTAYGTAIPETIYLGVPTSTTNSTVINNTIDFVATAN